LKPIEPKIKIDGTTGKVPQYPYKSHTVSVVDKDGGKFVVCIDDEEDDTLFFYAQDEAQKYADALADKKGYTVKK
jgi:hypothetical protein